MIIFIVSYRSMSRKESLGVNVFLKGELQDLNYKNVTVSLGRIVYLEKGKMKIVCKLRWYNEFFINYFMLK